MKKNLIFLLVLALSYSVVAQDFEGTIKMKMAYEGQAAEMMKAMSPSLMIIKQSGEKSSMLMEGGMSSMLGKIISNGKKSYMVFDAKKMAYELEDEAIETTGDEEETDDLGVELVDLNITEKIAGYDCKKYEVIYKSNGEVEDAQQISKHYMWVAQNLNVRFLTYDNDDAASKRNNKIYNELINGFPFKQEVVMNTQMGEIKMITEVTELIKGKIDASEFTVPENYTIKSIKEFSPFGY